MLILFHFVLEIRKLYTKNELNDALICKINCFYDIKPQRKFQVGKNDKYA